MYRRRDGSPSLQLTQIEQRAIVAYEVSAGLDIAERPLVASSGWLTRLRPSHWEAAASYHRDRATRLRADPTNDWHPLYGEGHYAKEAELDASTCQSRADALTEERDKHESEITRRTDAAKSAEHAATPPRRAFSGPVQAFRVAHSPLQIAVEDYQSFQEAIDDICQFVRDRHGVIVHTEALDRYAMNPSSRDDAPLAAWQFTEGEHFEIRARDRR